MTAYGHGNRRDPDEGIIIFVCIRLIQITDGACQTVSLAFTNNELWTWQCTVSGIEQQTKGDGDIYNMLMYLPRYLDISVHSRLCWFY